MKRLISFFVILFVAFTIPASAEQTWSAIVDGNCGIQYFDDGSYIITEVMADSNGDAISPASTVYTKTGTKTVSNYNSNDVLVWQYVLNCTYTINEGVSSVCTSAYYTQNIYDTSWSFSDGEAYVSGNTGYGKGLFRKKVLFITVSNVNIDVNLSCDAYGNFS